MTKKKQNIFSSLLLSDEGFLKKLLDSLPGILYLYKATNDDFKLIGWNKMHEIRTGYNASELSNMSFKEFFTEEDLPKVKKGVKKVFQLGNWKDYAFLVKKNGETIPYLFEGTKFEYKNSLYFFGVGLDISYEYKLQFNLKKVDKEIKETLEIIQKKERELLASAIQISENNEVVDLVKKKINTLITKDDEVITKKDLKDLEIYLESKFMKQNNWELFKTSFSQVHPDFFSNLLLACPTLTRSEIKYCAYLKINMSSDQIRSVLNISKEGIKKSRYRIRKKMGLLRRDSLEVTISKLK